MLVCIADYFTVLCCVVELCTVNGWEKGEKRKAVTHKKCLVTNT